MKEIGYFFAKVLYLLKGHSKETISNYFRKSGMTIGNNCNICCNIMTSEPYLVRIGNNVTVSGKVTLVTHDNAISKVLKDTTDLFGYVTIGDNSFVGTNSIIMYGVTLPKNTIVAAGAVVCNSFDEENIIIGGNPAKKIGTWDSYGNKNKKFSFNMKNKSENSKKDEIMSSGKVKIK